MRGHGCIMSNKNKPQKQPTNSVRATVERSRAAGYVRVAAVTQAHSDRNLRAQRARVRAKARQEGLRLVRIFEEAGASAHDMNRPGLAQLFALLNNAHI